MNKWASAALSAALLLTPAFAIAHGQPPQAVHGGLMQEAHENWVELLVNGTQMKIYILDDREKPVSGSLLSGTASVLIDGNIYKVQLIPGIDNVLEGNLPVSASGASAATVLLMVRGQPVSARFTIRN